MTGRNPSDPLSLFDTRCREAFRIIQAMHEGALTPAEALKEWRRVRGEAEPQTSDYREARVFTSFPLITIFAEDETEASQKLYALNDAINATPGISTELDEECYERVDDEHPDEHWTPSRA